MIKLAIIDGSKHETTYRFLQSTWIHYTTSLILEFCSLLSLKKKLMSYKHIYSNTYTMYVVNFAETLKLLTNTTLLSSQFGRAAAIVNPHLFKSATTFSLSAFPPVIAASNVFQEIQTLLNLFSSLFLKQLIKPYKQWWCTTNAKTTS